MDILRVLLIGGVVAGGLALWRVLRALPEQPWSEIAYRRMLKETDEEKVV